MRGRLLGADLGAHVADLDVAALGHPLGELGALAVGRLGGGDHHQPVAGGGEGGPLDGDVLAQIPGLRRPGGIVLPQRLVFLALPLLLLLPLADHVEEAGLLLGEQGGLVFLGGVLVQHQLGGLGEEAGLQVVDENGVAGPEGDPAVVRQEAGILLVLGGTGDLLRGARLQVLDEDVALPLVDLPPAVAAELAGRVRLGFLGRLDEDRLAGGEVDAVEVHPLGPDPLALALVVDGAAVVGPVGVLGRVPEPVGVGHDLFEGDRAWLGGRCGLGGPGRSRAQGESQQETEGSGGEAVSGIQGHSVVPHLVAGFFGAAKRSRIHFVIRSSTEGSTVISLAAYSSRLPVLLGWKR